MDNNTIRIDFIINKLSAGGAERVISLLANQLAKDLRYKIRVITFQGEDAYEFDSRVERIRLHKIFLFRSVTVNGFFNLLWFYRKSENRPSIISSHIDLLGYVTIPVAKWYGIPLIVSEHNNHTANNTARQSFLWKYLYRLADAVTILTSFDLEFFSNKNKRVVVMPNPCTFGSLPPSTVTQRKKDILAIGDLNRYHQKGFDNLMYTASEVLPGNKEWKLKIIGGGTDGMNLLKGLSEQYRIDSQIEFTGIRKDVQQLLQEAEIFILHSRYEGLPMVLLEAMSQGIACIAYDCVSGPSDIITHSINGILVKDQDKDEMAKDLDGLIKDEALRRKLQAKAPQALEKYTIENVTGKWQKLIDDVLCSK